MNHNNGIPIGPLVSLAGLFAPKEQKQKQMEGESRDSDNFLRQHAGMIGADNIPEAVTKSGPESLDTPSDFFFRGESGY